MSLEASIAELNTNIVTLIGVMSGASVSLPAPAATPAKTGTKKAAPAAASVAAASPTPQAAPTPQPAAASTPVATAAAPTIEQARKLVIELGQKKGREAVMTLLTKFGASKLPEVPPHQYAALIADATAALAA